jgi:CTD small phosphatase-like protein 2
MDETLLHYDIDPQKQEGFYLIRPFCEIFLRELSQYWEIVIFTASVSEYANWLIDDMDTENVIDFRLYRQHTTLNSDGITTKDLSLLGRPLSKTIIVDNTETCFLLTQPNNGIGIETWTSDMKDRALEILMPFLLEIA